MEFKWGLTILALSCTTQRVKYEDCSSVGRAVFPNMRQWFKSTQPSQNINTPTLHKTGVLITFNKAYQILKMRNGVFL